MVVYPFIYYKDKTYLLVPAVKKDGLRTLFTLKVSVNYVLTVE